jgi:hypothetical protein
MAATVAQKPAPRKAFRATLRDEAGVLAKVEGGEIVFFSDNGEIIEVEPEDCVWLCVLAEVGLSECQAALDAMHGGPVGVCLSRQMEVQ